jgi:hypothetical protein
MLSTTLPFREVLREIIEIIEVCEHRPPVEGLLIPVMLDDCPIHERLEWFQCFNLSMENPWERLLDTLQQSQPTRLMMN